MEGPSLVILREELLPFVGQKVAKISGNSREAIARLKNTTLFQIDTWGKVLFLIFRSSKKTAPLIETKTHFMMFGSYRINDPKKDRVPRVEFQFKNGTLYFYSCSFKMDGAEYRKGVDRKVDVLSPEWDPKYVLSLMEKKKADYLCDLLLNQKLFAGSGNIVKNEVLFNLRLHPLTKLSQVNKKKWPKLVGSIHDYCVNFYDWKKKYELRRHWQVYRQHYCPLCKTKLTKENNGKLDRKSFFCKTHQPHRYNKMQKLEVHPVLPMKNPDAKKELRLDH